MRTTLPPQWAEVEDFLSTAARTRIADWRPTVAKYLELAGPPAYRDARDELEPAVEQLGLAYAWSLVIERAEEIGGALQFARQTHGDRVPSPSAAREAAIAAAGALLVREQLKAAWVVVLQLPFADVLHI